MGPPWFKRASGGNALSFTSGWSDRVVPFQVWESSEVVVRGTQSRTVLDGERGKVCVAREVARRPELTNEVLQDRPVPIGGFEHADGWTGHPGIDDGHSVLRAQGLGHHARIRHEPEEAKDNRPCERHSLVFREDLA